MDDRKITWGVVGIVAAFLPIAELMNASFRGHGFYPFEFMIPAAYIEFAGAISLSYAISWIWNENPAKWMRVVAILALMVACVWVEVTVREHTETARYGRLLPSSQFPGATGFALGAMLFAARKKQSQSCKPDVPSKLS